MLAKLRNKQILPIHTALLGWWQNGQLPIDFQRQLIKARKKLQTESEVVEELRQRLLDKYAVVDGAGKRVMLDNAVKLTDKEAFDKEFDILMDGEFSCPAISLEDFESLFEKLAVTPAQFEAMLGDDDFSILVSTKSPAPTPQEYPEE